jgi:hypothetical protein
MNTVQGGENGLPSHFPAETPDLCRCVLRRTDINTGKIDNRPRAKVPHKGLDAA